MYVVSLVLLLLSCCTVLVHASHTCYFFIIMSPAEGLHFSALVCLFVTRGACGRAWAATGRLLVCLFV